MAAPLEAALRLCLAIALAGCVESPPPRAMTTAHHALIGLPVAVSLPDAEGALRAIPEPGSRATLIEFWVTYCGACGKSLPRMHKLAPALEREGIKVEFVAVLYDDEVLDAVHDRLREWGVARQFLVDRGGPFWRQFRIHVPAFVVLDNRGVVRWVGTMQAREPDAAAAARAVAAGEGS